jgi:osmotically-inducible protein OsmY
MKLTTQRIDPDLVRQVTILAAIIGSIVINTISNFFPPDGDIASAAINQIDWSTTIPQGTVEVTVRNGWITLEGEVEWWYQNAAGSLVKQMAGVKGVSNSISISPKVRKKEVETDIKSAFKRSAMLDAKHIRVETSGNNVVLHGQVRNYSEYDEAERVAWSEPGVSSVNNRLEVDWMF